MYCIQCGEQLKENARFCHACGARQEVASTDNNANTVKRDDSNERDARFGFEDEIERISGSKGGSYDEGIEASDTNSGAYDGRSGSSNAGSRPYDSERGPYVAGGGSSNSRSGLSNAGSRPSNSGSGPYDAVNGSYNDERAQTEQNESTNPNRRDFSETSHQTYQSGGTTYRSSSGPKANETQSTDTPISKQEALKLFIGSKSDYYFRKWKVEEDYVEKNSWNWAAFFLSFFWAGYRKMYGLIWVLIAIWLVIDGIVYSLGIDSNYIDSIIGLTTAIIFGLLGNYFYYLHASKKIEKHRGLNGEYSKQLLLLNGGTSGLGIFITIVSAIAYIIITTILYVALTDEEVLLEPEDQYYNESDDMFGFNDYVTDGQVEFGFGESGGYITSPSKEFSSDDFIYYAFDFPDGIGRDYNIVIEKVEATNYIYDSWYETVQPDWPGVIGYLLAPIDEGEYLLKVIIADEVIAKGTFYITDGYNETEHF